MTRRLPTLAALAAAFAALCSAPAASAPPREGAPVAWEVKPDPYPWKADAPVLADKQLPLAGHNPVVFPTSPSPYFGLVVPGGKNEAPQLQMYDLRRMEPVGTPAKPGKSMNNFPTFVRVSPWGDHFAVLDNQAKPATVWLATSTGEPVATSIVPGSGKEKIEACDWAGKDRLVTCMEIDRKRTWRVWDVKTGKEVLSFDYPLEPSEKWNAFSPGRRYLVMQESHTRSYHLYFWDLTTGKLAGKLQQQDPEERWGQCGNLAFSHDGKELALIWYLAGKEGPLCKIMRYDLVKGAKIGEHALRKEIEPSAPGFLAGGMRTLQFLPDDRGWLVSGHQIVERETGTPVWAIDPRPGHIGATQNRRFLDATHVTDTTGGRVLKVLTLPKAELDAALEKAKAAKPKSGG